jgi:hypothetical protein
VRIFAFLRGGPSVHTNVMRQVFDPNDLRPTIVNWEDIAGELLRHLQHGAASRPTDTRVHELLRELLSAPGVPARWHALPAMSASPSPVLAATYRQSGVQLRFFSMITVFETPRDVTLEDVRIECMFPADNDTTRFCRDLRTASAHPG